MKALPTFCPISMSLVSSSRLQAPWGKELPCFSQYGGQGLRKYVNGKDCPCLTGSSKQLFTGGLWAEPLNFQPSGQPRPRPHPGSQRGSSRSKPQVPQSVSVGVRLLQGTPSSCKASIIRRQIRSTHISCHKCLKCKAISKQYQIYCQFSYPQHCRKWPEVFV